MLPRINVQIFDFDSRDHPKHLERVSDSVEHHIDKVNHPLFTENAQKAIRSFVRTYTSHASVHSLGVAGLFVHCVTDQQDELTIQFIEWYDAIAHKYTPADQLEKTYPLGNVFATVKIRELTIDERMENVRLGTPLESIHAPHDSFKRRALEVSGLPLGYIIDAPYWLLIKFTDPLIEHTSSIIDLKLTSVKEDFSDPKSPKLSMVARYPDHVLQMDLDYGKLGEPLKRLSDRNMALLKHVTRH